MEAIRALQQQLMEAQRASNARKISERNCIDLVQKLIQTQQVKLFHTSNGKEYLTPEQLDNEIRDCLEACGGRISVTELPSEMGIGMEHLEARVEVLRKRDSSLHKLNNDLRLDKVWKLRLPTGSNVWRSWPRPRRIRRKFCRG